MNTNRLFPFAMAAAVALLSGCATQVAYTLTVQQTASSAAMVTSTEALAGYLMLSRPPVMVKTPTDRSRVQLAVTNISQVDLEAHYRVRWFDDKGVELNSLDPEKKQVIPAGREALLEDTCLSGKAASYKFVLDLPVR